jgi:hypothetical protein
VTANLSEAQQRAKFERFSLGPCIFCGRAGRYQTKAAARRAGRRHNQTEAYKCGAYWHYGTPPVPAQKPEVPLARAEPATVAAMHAVWSATHGEAS